MKLKTLGTIALCLWVPAAGYAQGSGNLLRNPDFERTFILGQPAIGWRVAQPAEAIGNGVREGVGMEDSLGHVISVPQDAKVTWYTCGQRVGGLQPGAAYLFSVSIRTDGVREGAGAYAGMNYFGQSGKRISWTDSARKVTGTSGWVRVSQAFTVPPGTVRAELQMVLHGHGTAFFDRAQVERGDTVTPWESGDTARSSSPFPPRADHRPSVKGTVGIFRDDIPATGTGSDPAHLRALVEQAGHGCAYLDTGLLSDPAVLNTGNLGTLVLPYGASFPARAATALKAFCRDGGNLFVFGGYPFDRMLVRQNGAWTDAAELVPDETRLTVLFDLSKGTDGWNAGGRDMTPRRADLGVGRAGSCLRLATPSLSGWVTASSPRIDGLPTDSEVTAFYARAEQDGVTLTFEWDEKDGSRWRNRVTLTGEWKLYAIAHADLEYWHDNPSEGRGGPEDRFHPENAAWMSVGLTQEFLRGGNPYTALVDRVSIGRDPFPSYRRTRLNSRRGTPNPATFLMTSPEAISICDAGAPLSDVARLSPTPGQTLLPKDWGLAGAATGFSATGQTAQGQPGAALKSRWVPVADALDRYGRPRGTGFALMHNFAGEYAGSTWAYSGVASRDLFAPGNAAGTELFRAVLRRLADGAFLFEAACTPRCARRQERLRLTVGVANTGSGERELRLSLALSSRAAVLARHTMDVTIPELRAEEVAWDWPVPADAPPGLVVARWELKQNGTVIDRLEAGAVVWDDRAPAGAAPLTYSQCTFARGRGPELLLGSQLYWGNGTVTGTDPLRWDHQLRAMADSGIRIARSFMWMPWMAEPDSDMARRRNDAMVQLAAANGVHLFYSGVSWPTTDPAVVRAKAEGAGAVATRYRAFPGWFVDIVNEPSLRVGEGEADTSEFRKYLVRRYGTIEALRTAWGSELSESSFDEISVEPMKGEWESVRAVDVNRFFSHKMRVWTAETARAIHAADPDRLVTVGHLQGFGGGSAVWDPIVASLDMDFANRHYYGDLRRYGPELKQTDLRVLGKAPSTGEFGATSHPGLRTHYVYEPEEEAARRFFHTVHTGFGLGGAFVSSWHWQDPIEDIFPCGLLLADGVPRARFQAFRNSGFLFRQIRPRYDPPELFFVVPTSHRFGMSRLPVEAAMNRALEALISLHVEFGVVTEESLSELPASARALVWPIPFCPEDSAFGAVGAFVDRGGHLYVSGDISYDRLRRRNRPDRLAALCGVHFVSERYPNIQSGKAESAALVADAGSPLAAVAEQVGEARPCIEVRAAGATVVARAGGVPAATLNRTPGGGTVLYVVDPVELHASPRPYLAAFLRQAGVSRHALTPDSAAVHSHRIPGQDGALAQVLLNWDDNVRTVRVTDLPARLELDLAPRWGGAVVFGGDGAVKAVEAQRATVAGADLFTAAATVGMIALGGADLRTSAGILILPFEAGELRLPGRRSRGWSGSVGEIRNGQWREYERFRLDGGRLSMDPSMARSLIVLGDETALERLCERVVREHL